MHDMHGNVLEWVYDLYAPYQTGQVIDPFNSSIGTGRVLRGGEFSLVATNHRSAWRVESSWLGYRRGFRIVRVPGGNELNSAPVARNDEAVTPFNTAITLNVLSNDTDTDADELSIVSISAVSGGSAQISSDNKFIVVVPAQGSSIPVSFSYTISDGNGGTDTPVSWST